MSRVSGKSYCVYVLWSSSASRFYIGISGGPQTRLKQHNAGISKWTSPTHTSGGAAPGHRSYFPSKLQALTQSYIRHSLNASWTPRRSNGPSKAAGCGALHSAMP